MEACLDFVFSRNLWNTPFTGWFTTYV